MKQELRQLIEEKLSLGQKEMRKMKEPKMVLRVLARTSFDIGKIVQRTKRLLGSIDTEAEKYALDRLTAEVAYYGSENGSLSHLNCRLNDGSDEKERELLMSFIANPLWYLKYRGFQRFLADLSKDERDAKFQNSGGVIRLPENSNIYSRKMEQDGLSFRLSGFNHLKVKGEFIVINPDKIHESMRYYEFKDWEDMCRTGTDKSYHFEFKDENATLKNFSEIMRRISKD